MNYGLRNRIFHGLAAKGFGQIITALIQVVSVPLFIHYWGIELYGEWLVLCTIPAYFAMSDVGFASVAANDMTMLVAKGERRTALEVFQSTWVFVSVTSFLVIIIFVPMVWIIPFDKWLQLRSLTDFETAAVVSFLILHVLLGLQGGFLHAGFRCEGRYARGILWSNLMRLAEFTAVTIGVCLGATPSVVALLFLGTRIGGSFMFWLDLHRCSPWIVFGHRLATRASIKRLAFPALTFMGFPAGNAISLQGMVMVVAAMLGPTSVVVFSTVRTLTRLGLQAMEMINSTVWPEISVAYGADDISLARKLHRHSCQASFWLCLSLVASLWFFGEWIIAIWTHGQVTPDGNLMRLLLAVIFANSLWYTSSVVMVAVNRHQQMALVYLIGTGLSLLLARAFIPVFGLDGAALGLLVIDVVMSVYVVRNSLKLLNDRLGDFLQSVLVPPFYLLYMRRVSR